MEKYLMVCGETNSGKSRALKNMAVDEMLNNKNIVYITTEESVRSIKEHFDNKISHAHNNVDLNFGGYDIYDIYLSDNEPIKVPTDFSDCVFIDSYVDGNVYLDEFVERELSLGRRVVVSKQVNSITGEPKDIKPPKRDIGNITVNVTLDDSEFQEQLGIVKRELLNLSETQIGISYGN